MASTTEMEKRVAALEAEVATLKKKAGLSAKQEIPWWEESAGAFANDPIYDEAMRLAREYRESRIPRGGRRRHGRARHRSA